MQTFTNLSVQLKITGAVLAIAALAAVLLAVFMTAGPTMAQGPDELEPDIPSNADHYADPVPCSEESEPNADTKSVITEGYYAVFDAFWDYEVEHLSDNFCPPEVTETTIDGEFGGEPTTTYTRSDANIHVSKTAFSIPTSYKVTVVDSAEINGNPSDAAEPKIDLADYPFLRDAVSAVETKEDSTTVFADNSIWWVRLDEPGDN